MMDLKLDEFFGEVEWLDKVSYKLEKNEEGYLFYFIVDENWLKDLECVYLVFIDLLIFLFVLLDMFVMSVYLMMNYLVFL